MRIMCITNYYPPYEVGGYEQLCRDVIERLTNRGYTVAVLTSDRGNGEGVGADDSRIFRQLRIMPRYSARLSPAVQFFLTRRRNEAYNRCVCRRVIQTFRPDIVFIWNLEGLPYELALDAESWPGTAVVYWLAHYSPAQPDAYWRYWTRSPGQHTFLGAPKELLARVALAQLRREGKPVRPLMRHVAVVSEWMRRKGLDENTLPTHTEVIYNGVETDVFYRRVPSPDTPPPTTLLLAGRLSADKGVHIAIEAMGLLARNHSRHDFKLIIAGSGPVDYLGYLRRLVKDYGINSLISFTGWLPRDQIPALMHKSEILLLTSIYPEGFSRVVLEGMAAGLAVIATLTGGTDELLRDGCNALTCEVENSRDLAHQINRLLTDPDLRYRLASRGQEMVLEQYSLDHMVEQIESLLERAQIEQSLQKGG
jgi:glycogen synthase